MWTKKLDDHIFMVDLTPCKVEGFISSYVIKSEKTALIESGPTCSVENLLSRLQELDVKLEEIDYVLVSHIHLDHGGGSGTLMRSLPNARLIVHPRGAKHMVNPEKLWMMARRALGKVAEMYGEPEPVPKERIIEAYDNMIIELGADVQLEILETVGHASHHQSFYEPASRKMFSGDAAGIHIDTLDVVVPTTPEPLYLDAALAAIQKMKEANPKTLCYTHFGCAENAVERLSAHASQLKLWKRIVSECLAKGEDLEAIRNRIIEEDACVKKAASFMRFHPIMGRGMLLQNIQSFVNYVKRSKEKK